MKTRLLLLTILFTLTVIQAIGQNVNILDANFKSYLVGNSSINTNGDGEIQVSEAQAFTGTINCSNQNIADLTGIEAFTSITQLSCFQNQLTALDVSQNTALTILNAFSNNITSIDVSQNTALTSLSVARNSISSLDVSQNTALRNLLCSVNQLTTLDITQNTALEFLQVSANQLTTLDVTNNINLTRLECSTNQITSLDVSQNTALTFLDISSNSIASLNLSNNTNLEDLNCFSNQLTSLDVSNNINLDFFICSDNQLTSLDVSQNTALAFFLCSNNQLGSLDLSNNPNLITLACSNIGLTSLDMSGYPHLTRLEVNDNELTSLNVANGNNTDFTTFNATGNPNLSCIRVDDVNYSTANWTDVDMGVTFSRGSCTPDAIVNIPDTNFKNALLAHDPVIDINGDSEISFGEAEALTGSLNLFQKSISDATGLEAFINLTRLNIGNNSGLSSLDVSANTKLTYLFADNLNLSIIDVSQNTLLDTLAVFANNLSNIDVSNNINLKYLWAGANSLTSIDLSANTALEFLRIDANNISSFNPPSFLNNQLKALGYGSNPFASAFDFTVFLNLEELYCFSSGLTSLDVSSLANLKTLWALDNPITTLDLSNNTALENISIGATWIENLDLSNNTNLTTVVAAGSPTFATESRIETINLANGNNEAITALIFSSNPLLSCVQVDDPNNAFPNAETVLIDESKLSSFCVPGTINFADPLFEAALLNHEPAIDTNGDGIITRAEAADFTSPINLSNTSGNGIRNAKEISNFTNLISLDLSGNRILNLDLSQNGALTEIDLANTNMRVLSLDNGNNTAITSLVIPGNTLECVTVDDPAYSATNWGSFPSTTGVSYSTDCDVQVSPGFKTRLIGDGYDTSGDGEIQVSEAEAVTGSLNYRNSNLDRVDGVEAFINIILLDLGSNAGSGLTFLDVTQNTKLTQLQLPGNSINSIDLSCNSELNVLNLSNSSSTTFTILDLSNNTALTSLTASSNHFKEIDFSNSRSLSSVSLVNNALTDLDFSHVRNLRFLNVQNNDLTSLNVKNGNIEGIFAAQFRTNGNPNLTCIEVDDVAYAETNFTNIDPQHSFDIDCDNFPIPFADANLETALLSYAPAIDANGDGDIRLSEATAFTGVLNLSGLSITTADELQYFTGATGLDISNNNLTLLNIRNGNNRNFTVFDARGNSGLGCIKVDQALYSTENWSNIDVGASFSAYCDPNETVYIPDEVWKTRMIVAGVDTDGDEEISYAEALAFTGELNTTTHPVTDVTGLEAFENLTGLEIGNSATIDELDITANTQLTKFIYSQREDRITAIDLTSNPLLEILSISIPLASIDLTNFSNLNFFGCSCNLSSLDVTQNTSLTTLVLNENEISEIDLSNNALLTLLSITDNSLQTIDLTALTELTRLNLQGPFTSMDLFNQVKLEELIVDFPQFQSIDLSNNALLEFVRIGGDEDENDNLIKGKLEEVILPDDPTRLWQLGLRYNNIRNIDISNVYQDPIGPNNSVVSLEGNDLHEINIGLVNSLNLTDNPNLTCAQTTDVTYAETNYDFDPGLFFSTDVCADPTDIMLSSISFDENTTAAIGTFTTADESMSNMHTYTFFDDGTETNNGQFDIIGDEIFPKEALDFEGDSQETYLIKVQSDDGFGGLINKQFTLTLNDVNEAPTDLTLSNNTVDESNPIGTVVGILSTTDEDDGQTHTYTLVSGPSDLDNASFTILGNQLVTTEVFDYEIQGLYSIRVRTDDGNGGVFESGFGLMVNNLPASITSINLDNNTVNENETSGTLVGTLSTFGEDLSGSYAYTLVSGMGDTDNASFSISGDQLLTAQSFDFEIQSGYSIRVMTDDGSLTREEILEITINDVSEAPTDISLNANAMAENNNINDLIGTLSTTDEDMGDTHTYILVAGIGDTDNASFAIVGDQLQAATVFDFETQNSFSIRIQTDDGNGGAFEKAFAISITNVNESISISNPIADQTLEVGFSTLEIDLSNVFVDTDNDALTFGAMSLDKGVVTVDVTNATLTITEVGLGTSTIMVTADDGSDVTNSDEFTVTVNEILVISDHTVRSMKVYPNPSRDHLNIELTAGLGWSGEIFSVTGVLMQRFKEMNPLSRIDIRGWAEGLYYLRLRRGNESATTKILIER